MAMILATRFPLNVRRGGDYIIGANQVGKRACSMLNCIFVTDDSETNEQNKSIAIQDSSMHTPNLTRFQHSYVEKWGFLTPGVNDCCIHITEMCRNRFTQREMAW